MIRLSGNRHVNQAFLFALALSITAAGAFLGCRGDEGPAGQDGSSFDTVPPTITLSTPQFGDTLVDTLVAQAYAVDNVEINEVTFYLDGTSEINDSTWSTVFNEPYQWTFDLADLGIGPGAHTIMARAYDVERNWSETPTIIFYLDRLAPPGPGVLRLGKVANLDLRVVPLRDSGDSTIVLDSLLFGRFTADRQLRIDSVRVWVDTLFEESIVYDQDLLVEIHESNGVYPTNRVAAGVIDSTTLDGGTPGWRSVDFTGNPIQFEAGERFHVTLSVDAPSDTTLMALGVIQVPVYSYETANRSGFYDLGGDPQEYVTFQEYLPNVLTVPELLIEVYVNRMD